MLDRLTGLLRGPLYRALYRLERKGLIASEWGESENHRKAKPERPTHTLAL